MPSPPENRPVPSKSFQKTRYATSWNLSTAWPYLPYPVSNVYAPRSGRYFPGRAARTMVDLMQEPVRRPGGTSERAQELKRPVAGKTGTTNDFTDAWFIGYTPSLVAGVWIGFDEKVTLGDKETGGKAALPMWIDFMKEVYKDKPIEQFDAAPKAITSLVQ